MTKLLLQNNRRWAQDMLSEDPSFFQRLSQQQSPKYLWIGCSDSRVPANEIVGMLPGELFVHRNVANIVFHNDLNCLSVIKYAVDVLKVEHIIVCGHYLCGGIQAAVRNSKLGLIENWLRHVQDIGQKHRHFLPTTDHSDWAVDRMCEINVIEQVENVSRTTILQDAWLRGQPLQVHGWIYSVTDGLLKDLGMTVSNSDEITQSYENAIRAMERKINADHKHTPK